MEKLRQDKSCDPCKTLHDKHSEDVSGFCVQCVEYLCKTCVEHHRKLKASRSHVILTGQDIPGDKTAFQLLEKLGKCPVHEDEELTHECKQHEMFLCVVCAKDKHIKCGSLVEISLNLKPEIYMEKLSEIQNRLEENGDEIRALKEDLDNKAGNVIKQAKEIREKQMSLRFKLENVLQDLKRQEENVEKSCKNKLEIVDTNKKKLKVIENKIELSKKFTQVVAKYGRPSQMYIVANGQFEHSETDIQALKHDYISLNELELGDFDIKADILNLLLTVKSSRFLCDTSSDSVDDEPNSGIISLPQDETQGASRFDKHKEDTKISDLKKIHLRTMMDRSIDSGTTQNVLFSGENKQCDIVGVDTIDALGLIILADYANTNLKVFDSNFTALNSKSLHTRPCSLCTVKNGHVAILLVEKTIVIVDVTREAIKHLNTFNINLYGHSLANYGHKLAVLCSDNKFNGDQTLQAPAKVLVINQINGDIVKELDEFYLRPREEEKKVWFENPCQIYSRSSSELIVSTEESIKNFDSNGVQRWYYRRSRQLRGASGITSDNEDNIYVCGYGSNNVHQIFSLSYNYSRMVIPEIEQPWAITFDKKEEQLIVSSRHSNTITIYKFGKK